MNIWTLKSPNIMSNVELNSCTVMVNTLHFRMYHLSHDYQNLTESTVFRPENKTLFIAHPIGYVTA